MQKIIVPGIFAILASSAFAAVQKANEYKSDDCSGNVNYGHHSLSLGDVSMDDSSHSVYLGTTGSDRAAWEAFDGKIGDGKDCAGISLGLTRHLGCIDLDAEYAGRRIRCVRYHDH